MTGQIVLISTGGTIAMVSDTRAGGAVPTLRGEDLRQQLATWSGLVEVVEHCNLPSAHFTTEILWSLRQRVRELVRQPDIDGIVISTGTDVMEETSYLLDLTVEGDKPIVLTGAMRTATDPGYEGPANLLAALRVAAAPEARGVGAVVVLEDEIHAARTVIKMHTTSPRTFQSPFWGPLGRVEAERVFLRHRPERHILETEHLEERVLLIKMVVGMNDGLLRYAVEWGMRGVVLEVLGGGRVPDWWMPTIREAIEQEVSIVITSRCPAGLVYDRYAYEGALHDLMKAGCIHANGLSGPKARIKLMAALGAGLEGKALGEAFEREP